jgi:RNA polymerase sigma-70 factor (ECF subfamily)
VSALHAQAKSYAETDWAQIAALYGQLVWMEPTAVVRLNYAVALGMAQGPLAGLVALDSPELANALAEYHPYHAARADMLRRAGDRQAAAVGYARAAQLAQTRAERAFLTRRRDEMLAEQ